MKIMMNRHRRSKLHGFDRSGGISGRSANSKELALSVPETVKRDDFGYYTEVVASIHTSLYNSFSDYCTGSFQSTLYE